MGRNEGPTPPKPNLPPSPPPPDPRKVGFIAAAGVQPTGTVYEPHQRMAVEDTNRDTLSRFWWLWMLGL